MTAEPLRIATEEDRERLYAARRNGGMCAACGRALGAGETVYRERFKGVGTTVYGPVGRECASADTLTRTEGVEPEPCVACGRGIYYPPSTKRPAQAFCSRRCGFRAAAARWQMKG